MVENKKVPPALPARIKRNSINNTTLALDWNQLLDTEIDINELINLDLSINSITKDDISRDVEKIKLLYNLPKLKLICINSSDINILCYMNTVLNKLSVDKQFHLLDDFQNKDRSYIDKSNLDANMELDSMPYPYIMWNPNLGTCKYFNSGFRKNNNGSFISFTNNGDYSFPSETTIDFINKYVTEYSKIPDLSVIDKVVLVSNFLQENVQFAEGKISYAIDGKYIIDNLPDKFEGDSVNDLLELHVGKCSSISRLMTLMLNNPIMNVDCRVQKGEGHYYCIIGDENGNLYASDPTWGISRNPDRYENALKAKSFSYDYLLLGENDLDKIPHHDRRLVIPKPLSKNNVDRNLIEQSINKLKSYGIKFEYPDGIPYPSAKDTSQLGEDR